MDVVQSKRTNLADGNDNIADQARKRSAVLPAESTDPIIAKLKVPVCNSICDVETADSASVLMNDDAMNDEDAHFEDEVDELPASSFISNEAESAVSTSQIELQDRKSVV